MGSLFLLYFEKIFHCALIQLHSWAKVTYVQLCKNISFENTVYGLCEDIYIYIHTHTYIHRYTHTYLFYAQWIYIYIYTLCPVYIYIYVKLYICQVIYIYILCQVYTYIERGSSGSHYVESSLWKRLWTCRKTDD